MAGEVLKECEIARDSERSFMDSVRAPNPWPKPSIQKTGSSFARSSEPRKFGGRFGSGSYPRRASEQMPDYSSSDFFHRFGTQKNRDEATFENHTNGFGGGGSFGSSLSSRLASSDTLYMNKDQCLTPSPSENVLNNNGSRRGYYDYSYSKVISPAKRARSGRRTGRRGRGGLGHCFHCQVHGHISRTCPNKDAEADDFEGVNQYSAKLMYKEQNLLNAQGDGLFQNVKLENQKARESYYGGFGYVANMNSPVTKPGGSRSEENSSNSIASLEINKCSDKVKNVLKLNAVVEPLPPPSPGSVLIENEYDELKPQNETIASQKIAPSTKIRKELPETLTIETRRTVKRDGKHHFEETTVINFPRSLPPNVRVIAAQFVPVSSQE